MAGGEAGNTIGKLCAGRATKIVRVDRSAEPFVARWDDNDVEVKHEVNNEHDKFPIAKES